MIYLPECILQLQISQDLVKTNIIFVALDSMIPYEISMIKTSKTGKKPFILNLHFTLRSVIHFKWTLIHEISVYFR